VYNLEAPFSIKIPRESYCPYCGCESIEMYTESNKATGYKRLLDMHANRLKITGLFDRTVLSHFRCVICRRKFMINWIYGYPVPLINSKYTKN
jgi:hypothetical protein